MWRVGILPLEQLPRGEGRAGVRERAQLGLIFVTRELRKRAREQQVTGGNGDLAPGSGSHGRTSTAQLSAVDHIVVHERRRVDELDRDSRADQALVSRVGIERGAVPRRGGSRKIGRGWREKIRAGGLGGEYDEQRTQPLAAGHDRRVGVLGERSTRGGHHTLQVQLDASHPLAQLLAAVVNECLECICIPGRAGGGVLSGVVTHPGAHTPSIGTVPKWITTMPPAVSR